MNFLQICQAAARESGLSGTGPTSVENQTGEMLQVVNWCNYAHEDIQNLRPDWAFAQEQFDFETISGTAEYTPLAVSITDLLAWKTNDFRVYLNAADETFLTYLQWDEFRYTYQYGTSRTTTGRPTIITVEPDDSLFIYPIPDDEYTIDGQYFKKPSVMSVDADTPRFKSNFHMAVVWRAVMLYSAEISAQDLYYHGEKEYKKVIRKLEFNQLPKISYGAPMA